VVDVLLKPDEDRRVSHLATFRYGICPKSRTSRLKHLCFDLIPSGSYALEAGSCSGDLHAPSLLAKVRELHDSHPYTTVSVSIGERRSPLASAQRIECRTQHQSMN
jgi:hypothetical protein